LSSAPTEPARIALRRPGFAALLLLALAAPGGAQTNADVNAGLQFSFVPPGARSLAMGGAFTGLADDATAAWTNPAGLVSLGRPEVSLELRTATYTNRFPSGGVLREPGEGSSRADASGVGFASFVWTAPSRRWAASAFFHRLADFAARQESQSIEGNLPRQVTDDVVGRIAFLDLDIPGLGAAGSFRFDDRFSIGVSLVSYQIDLLSESRNLVTDVRWTPDVQSAHGDDRAWAASLGLLWATEDTRISAVYRRGPKFSTEHAYVCGDAAGEGGARLCETRGIPIGGVIPELTGASTFRVPDVAALGVSVRVTPRVTLAAEIDQVFYSQYSDEISNVTVFGIDRPDFVGRFSMEDATEIHAGAELQTPLAGGHALYLRAGGWFDPDHRLRVVPAPNQLDQKIEVRFNSLEEEDQVHFTGGLGLTFGTHVQVDLAADFSDLADVVSLSAVYRF